MTDPRAGTTAEPSDLVDVAHLVTSYYTGVPDPSDPDQRVAFGTSGHRGSSLDTAFNETHIVATTQAICDYRRQQGYDGPLFVGRDTHGLSEPAWPTSRAVASRPTCSGRGCPPALIVATQPWSSRRSRTSTTVQNRSEP